MSHPKSADLEALLEALQQAKIDYVVVGGVAAVLHGAPITTLDLDIVHKQTAENIERLLGMLEAVEAELRPSRDGPPLRPTREMLGGIGQLNLSTSLGPLDILCRLHSGETYDELIATAVLKHDRNLELRAIDLETLIRIKSSTGRIKDKMTIPLLMSLRPKKPTR